MPHIQALDGHVAELIAAGEVVERPASVVKELVENAIDAKASAVVVSIRRGGMGMIRVSDNGCGIAPEELPTAFLRHATSKVRTEKDLASIGTLGFRGEALAAIASVAKIDLFTRTSGNTEGVQISIEGGKETGYFETGCPRGTTVVMRDLFFNVPARAKFLKRDATESGLAENVVAQIAIAHPEIAIRFLKDGRESFSTPGDGKMRSAIYACAGRDVAGALLQVSGSFEEVYVEGFVSPPELSRASRAQQSFFINGRSIRSRTLSAAVEEAYKGRLMTGRYPVCFLSLQISPVSVDVNVHPAKLEVKFSREREIFSAVYHCVVTALEGDARLAEMRQKTSALLPKEDRVTKEQQTLNITRTDGIPTYGESFASTQTKVAERASKVQYMPVTDSHEEKIRLVEPVIEASAYGYTPKTVQPAPVPAAPKKPAPPVPEPPQTPPAEETEPAAEEKREGEPPAVRVLGEVFHTYVIAEDKDGLWLIDKHAARERMLYNQITGRKDKLESQLLLTPKTVTLSAGEKAVLLEQSGLLADMGFSVEDFGRGAVLVREAPMYLAVEDIPFVVSDMAQRLSVYRGPENGLLDDLLKSISCKAAIKAGMDSDTAELQRFAEKVLGDDSVRNCPHGRPCVTYLSRYQLEKLFKRVV